MSIRFFGYGVAMFPFRILLTLFFLIPLIEIYLLIKVGSWLGAWPTVLLVVFTAVLGAFLLKQQGLATLERVRQSVAEGRVPAVELLEGAMLIIGGALLLTPGFFTDAIGFICLIPPLRRKIIVWAIQRGLVMSVGGGGKTHRGPQTLDGECWREDDDNNNNPRPR